MGRINYFSDLQMAKKEVAVTGLEALYLLAQQPALPKCGLGLASFVQRVTLLPWA